MNDTTTAKPRTIKVWAQVSIEVDVDALAAEYGRSFTIAEAREDVFESISGVLAQTLYPESTNIVLHVTAKK